MPSARTLTQVVPDWQSGAPDAVEVDNGGVFPRWQQYRLQPAHKLPVVDLSISVRSRYLSPRWLAAMTRWMRRGRLIFSLFVTGVVLLTAMFVVQDVVVAQVLGAASAMLMLPSSIIGFSVLRFDIVRLLLRTYDFWFFFLCNVANFVVVSGQFADARIAATFAIWAGTTFNIFVDANLRGARRMAIMNLGVVLSMGFFLVGVKTEWIVSLRAYVLLRYGAHELPAQAFVVSCLLTIGTMVMRNIVRSRQALRQGSNQQIRCVSYRCTLRLVRLELEAAGPTATDVISTRSTASALASVEPGETQPGENADQAPATVVSPVQRLQCILMDDRVDARQTILPCWLLAIGSRSRIAQLLVQVVGLGAFVVSLVAAALADYRVDDHDQPASPQPSLDSSWPHLQLTAVLLTAVYNLVSAVCFVRKLYTALLWSFDFVYLCSLLALLHITACDYFAWRLSPCLVVLTCWLWIQWAVGVDALSPLVKQPLRIHLRFPAVVISTSVASGLVLLYKMIVVDPAPVPYDRVLWSTTALGKKPVELRLMGLFYNSMASVLAWSTRLLYRLWTFDSDMLIVLDGPVAYDNYLSRPRQPRQERQRVVSRPWNKKSGSRKASS